MLSATRARQQKPAVDTPLFAPVSPDASHFFVGRVRAKS
jgi:hypothetical protein